MSRIIGYARVSTVDQNSAMQFSALDKAGCEEIFEEKVSGARKDRPMLIHLLKNVLKPGDTIVVYKLDRLARSLKHLIELMEYFQENDINFKSIKDPIDTSSPIGKLMFSIIASIAEFERSMIIDRCKAGTVEAKKRGVKFGRPPTLDQNNIKEACERILNKEGTLDQIANAYSLSRSTLYYHVRKMENERAATAPN